MIPREAIQKAIQGGYGGRFDSPETILASHSQWQLALSAPFWQALSKALGWVVQSIQDPKPTNFQWYHEAHRFYDLILRDKSTAEFWEELLSDNK